MKENILVSACFLKGGYKYNGKDNICQKVLALQEKYNFIIICPEFDGGLSSPRLPSEVVGNKVLNSCGDDVTKQFVDGANKALDLAKKYNCKKAILKANSPSCGKGQIYDGTFSHKLVDGNGIACDLLIKNGISVYTEFELDLL